MNHADAIALISSMWDITAKPPTNTGLVDNFKVNYSLADSFKNSIKRDSGIFTTFKEGKYWDAWRKKTLATSRAQDAVEVINSDHLSATDDDVNFFK